MTLSRMGAFFIKLISTFFFIGYLPFIPGTFGSISGVVIFYFFGSNRPLYFGLTCIFLALGFLVSGRAEKVFDKKDPSCVVIDEVVGMLIALGFAPADLRAVFLAFLFFRIFDTLKVYPGWRLQNIRGSAGIMSDDIVAGIYAALTLQLALRLASLSSS